MLQILLADVTIPIHWPAGGILNQHTITIMLLGGAAAWGVLAIHNAFGHGKSLLESITLGIVSAESLLEAASKVWPAAKGGATEAERDAAIALRVLQILEQQRQQPDAPPGPDQKILPKPSPAPDPGPLNPPAVTPQHAAYLANQAAHQTVL
jgi:hypothetical protein